ncbi:MAG TPA: hypothetical protein VIT44_17235 [Cyclobacteriaceae bacterium]
MKENTSRRFFLKSGLVMAGGLIAPIYSKASAENTMQDKPAPISSELVLEFVKNAHGNFEKVKELLDKQPNLLNAAWDWGNGDYETGMNAAGHTGRVEIAEYLLSKGARIDIFCAAMLGKLDIVKPVLEAYPNLKSSKGPHGLALIHHAEKGGDNAKSVLAYLKEIGAS